ncbi:sodium-translocating pyrophosphatase [Candidatus Micrarchaeota archaeon]|nr:sodium-translocating pyrophosphatase [Candidatus Micrarchaeota archaeon]
MVSLNELAPVFVVIILALGYVSYLVLKILKKKFGTEKVKELSEIIHNGALTYLNKQYKILIIFVIIATIAIYLFKPNMAIAFVIGAVFSAVTGNIGMRIATAANGRTAHACEKSLNSGLDIAFSSGAIMGLTVVSLGLAGIAILYYVFGDPEIIYGFGFGASSIALFARVGGGIYTKAADVGADLVGKIEKGIPEDDPRNPGVIADQVGDNVGDVAGMGADLFESYVDSIIATMVIGSGLVATWATGSNAVILPLMIASVGILSSLIGMFFVRTNGDNPSGALNKGIWAAAIIMLIGSYFVIDYYTHDINIWYATISGLVAGVIIGGATEYYTSENYKPAQTIAAASQTGAATNLITGLALGMESTLIPVLAVCAAIIASYHFAGLYGIAIAAVGMLSTLGITLAADTYGPVVDNAAGIAEMAGLGKKVRERAEKLDAVGNTTAAMGKGFAIGSAALTALALFSSYSIAANLKGINVAEPTVIVGLFIGALLPFLFSSFTMNAVGKAANQMIDEIRRQFKNIKGIMTGKAKPDYNKCIEISTEAALKEMIVPGAIAVLSPIIIGLLLGPEALGGMLAGAITSGFLLALLMANAGGAWDNAKKYIESGNFGGKGSYAHKAAVVGDTVGDPFKDTSGPSLNILIKLMTIIALIFAIIMYTH